MRFDASKYVTVQDRINQFWKDYPEGRIETTLASMPSDFERALYRAEVYRNVADAHPAATGYSMAIAGTGGANQTAWHENAETSAIGRALANMGYATSLETRPSLEEMQKSADMAASGARPAAAPAPQQRRPMANPNPGPGDRQPTEKQLWLVRKLISDGGYTEAGAISLIPGFDDPQAPTSVVGLDKFEVSKLIEILKGGDQPTPIRPAAKPDTRPKEFDPYDDAPEPVEPEDAPF